ncbi:GNAT family N-acetyltransferase [Roseibium sp. RKSG952]|uniref:GNAT family N-acetyltransferase n=1 Tax=Roseibium sp. RKSG952 TaxID=2529384 RepID=UPI0012BC52CF|nr:GNAT family N-acetyltransferase [Roseibium sp. RKSG952]MTH95327.1 GNAT family N-acetyltransferase [Roseibium sp. RKSG952]
MNEGPANACTIEKAQPEHLKDIVALLNAGATSVRRDKEFATWQDYRPAFEALCSAPEAAIYVALDPERHVVGTYQIHFLKGLAYQGRPRVELESVHVRADQQGTGVGRQMVAHAEQLAREAGACLLQLTSNREREGSHHFYRRLGFDQSHLGYKKMLM